MSPQFQPRDPEFAARAQASFARQNFMQLIGARMVSITPGAVEIALPFRADLDQQHGYIHAGATWSIADSAAGYAAQSLMATDEGVLTVELKINLLAPGRGERLIARGRVERPGRRLIVGRSDVYAIEGETETHIAIATGTYMVMQGLADKA